MDDSCAVCADALERVAYEACGHKEVCSTCVATHTAGVDRRRVALNMAERMLVSPPRIQSKSSTTERVAGGESLRERERERERVAEILRKRERRWLRGEV